MIVFQYNIFAGDAQVSCSVSHKNWDILGTHDNEVKSNVFADNGEDKFTIVGESSWDCAPSFGDLWQNGVENASLPYGYAKVGRRWFHKEELDVKS